MFELLSLGNDDVSTAGRCSQRASGNCYWSSQACAGLEAARAAVSAVQVAAAVVFALIICQQVTAVVRMNKERQKHRTQRRKTTVETVQMMT